MTSGELLKYRNGLLNQSANHDPRSPAFALTLPSDEHSRLRTHHRLGDGGDHSRYVQFRRPREFAAFLGLTPKQNSSGGKPKLGRFSKMGNRNLRKLLVVGAHAVLFHRKPHTDPLRMFAKRLLEKKPFKLVAVALANKMARIAFAILRGKMVYREIPA